MTIYTYITDCCCYNTSVLRTRTHRNQRAGSVKTLATRSGEEVVLHILLSNSSKTNTKSSKIQYKNIEREKNEKHMGVNCLG